jgi:hypothetical protein
MRVWRTVASSAAGVAAFTLLPGTIEARVAPPTGTWQGTVVILRDGVPRGRWQVQLTITSLQVGRISARAYWPGPPRCMDILRLERARAGHLRYSIAATVGACLGRSWVIDLTRRAPRRMVFRGTSKLPRFAGLVYTGTLVRPR